MLGIREAAALLILAVSGGGCADSAAVGCDGCTIEFEHVVRLGSVDGPGALGSPSGSPVVSRLADGRYIVIEQDVEGLRFYGADGKFQGTFGRRGGGPGEYLMPVFHSIDAPGDTLMVVDREAGRMTLLSVDATTVFGTRPFPMPFAPYLLFLPDGRMVANGLYAGDEHIGLPLHLVSRDGEIVRSFGADLPVYLATEYNQYFRMMENAHDGGVWAGEVHRYRVEKWDTTGRLIQRLDREVDWFPLRDRPHIPRSPNADPPSTRLSGIWESEPGLLWIALRIASPTWRDVFYEVPGPGGAKRYRRHEPEGDMWMTRFEILDVSTGQALATRDFPRPIMTMLGDGYFATPEVDANDIPFIDVWRLHPSPPQRGRSQ